MSEQRISGLDITLSQVINYVGKIGGVNQTAQMVTFIQLYLFPMYIQYPAKHMISATVVTTAEDEMMSGISMEEGSTGNNTCITIKFYKQ